MENKNGNTGLFQKGSVPWNKGKKASKETRKKISDAGEGRKHTKEAKKKISETLTGRKKPPRTEEHKRNLGKSIKGRIPWNKDKKGLQIGWNKGFKGFYITSEETKRKLSKANKDKIVSEEAKRKISIANKGEKNGMWQGGISFEPYAPNWTETLKKSIRERDNYTCQLCGEFQDDETYSVHHIDYDKKNCNPDNLITLCKSCHAKTNANRKYWLTYLLVKTN